MRPDRHSSVRWRIVLVYFMLVFIAMTIVSVFLLDRMEDYQLSSLRDNMTKTVSESNLLTALGNYEDLAASSNDVQQMLDRNWNAGFAQELSVVDDDLLICASTNPNLTGLSAADVFDSDIIVSALLSGENGESDGQTSDGIAVKNLSFPVMRQESSAALEPATATGVIYVRCDLTSTNSFIARSRSIFIQGIVIALVVTVVLGFVLARSITDPINSVTDTVLKMSQGDFSIEVPVKSDDEIGQLAEMFNLLRRRLDFTLTEISNEKNKLGTILQYMADGLIAIDLDGKVIHMNPAARQMVGIPLDENLVERNYDALMGHMAESMSLAKIRENCGAEGGQDIVRYGQVILAVRYDHFKDEDGTDIGIIIIMQDITERQKLEDMQTDFVANVSHELKTPLTTIKSYAETLLDGAVTDPEMQDSFLEIINNETDRMTRLVRDLLQLSRLDHRQERMDIKEGNIVALVNSVVTKMAMTAGQKQQSLTGDYDGEMNLRVMFDKDMMEQVLQNIISNAIKYTPEGGHIVVAVAQEKGAVRISVKDDGIGIPPEALPRIFERFYRVDKARSRAMGSTGLGLAITRQIVEEHGGLISVDSTVGEGTTMTLSLPLAFNRGVRIVD